MILKISEWISYLPLISFLDVIFFHNKERKLLYRILQALFLIFCIYTAGFLCVAELQKFIDVERILYLSKALRWNVHNIILFFVFIICKIKSNRKQGQLLFGISILSCMFAIVQLVFYYRLFLSSVEGLTANIIGLINLCSTGILFIQGAMLELMERNMQSQDLQNEEEKRLLKQKYEQDYYQLTMEQKESVTKLQNELSHSLLEVQALVEDSAFEKEGEIQKILIELEESVGRIGKISFCKDSLLNTILALKYAGANKENLDMKINVDSYAKTEVEDFDMCSLVSNLLDNAIEASRRVKNSGIEPGPICVHIGCRGGYLIFKVENSIAEALKRNGKGKFVSSKKESYKTKRHGRGITIMENILEKYGGYLRFEEKENRLSANVFLPSVEKK